MKSRITQYIKELVLDQGDEVDISADEELLTVGLDSIGFMRLISFIEDTFGVDIPPEDVTIESFGTVTRIATYLERQKESST